MDPHRLKFSTQTGRRRRPPTQSPAKRVCVGEEERWSERALSGRTKRGIRNPRRRSGPGGIAEATQILRAGNIEEPTSSASPVMGSRGRRIWARSAHPEPPPSGSLVTFWASRKSLAARRRRNPHAKRISQRPDEGIGPYRGKPEWGAAGAHPRVASLGLRPIHLQPPPYGVGKDEADGETSLLNF